MFNWGNISRSIESMEGRTYVRTYEKRLYWTLIPLPVSMAQISLGSDTCSGRSYWVNHFGRVRIFLTNKKYFLRNDFWNLKSSTSIRIVEKRNSYNRTFFGPITFFFGRKKLHIQIIYIYPLGAPYLMKENDVYMITTNWC